MRQANIDVMIEFAIAALASEDHQRIRGIVRRMAEQWPNEQALGIALAITSAAASFEDVIDDASAGASAQRGYKLAALVAADAFAVQSMGQMPARGSDLLHFWRRVDPYFLRN